MSKWTKILAIGSAAFLSNISGAEALTYNTAAPNERPISFRDRDALAAEAQPQWYKATQYNTGRFGSDFSMILLDVDDDSIITNDEFIKDSGLYISSGFTSSGYWSGTLHVYDLWINLLNLNDSRNFVNLSGEVKGVSYETCVDSGIFYYCYMPYSGFVTDSFNISDRNTGIEHLTGVPLPSSLSIGAIALGLGAFIARNRRKNLFPTKV